MNNWKDVWDSWGKKEFDKFIIPVTTFWNYPYSFYNNKSILDIGCGLGRISYDILNNSKPRFVRACDSYTEKAREFLSKFNNCCVCEVNVLNMKPLRNGQYDIVIAKGLIHHTENPYLALKEICRVSNKYVFLITTGCNGWIHYKLYLERFILKFIPRKLLLWISKGNPYIRHRIFDSSKAPIRKALNYQIIEKWLDEFGFDIIKDKSTSSNINIVAKKIK